MKWTGLQKSRSERSSYKQILGQIKGQAPNNISPVDILWFEMTRKNNDNVRLLHPQRQRS